MAEKLSSKTDLWKLQSEFNEKMNSDLNEIQEMMNSMMDTIRGLNKSINSQNFQSSSSSIAAARKCAIPPLEAGIRVTDGAGQPSPLNMDTPGVEESIISLEELTRQIREDKVFEEMFLPNPIDTAENQGVEDGKFQLQLNTNQQQWIILNSWSESENEGNNVKDVSARVLQPCQMVVSEGDEMEKFPSAKIGGLGIVHHLFDEMPSPPSIELNEENVEANDSGSKADCSTNMEVFNQIILKKGITPLLDVLENETCKLFDKIPVSTPDRNTPRLASAQTTELIKCKCKNPTLLSDNDVLFHFDPGGCTLFQMDCESFELLEEQEGLSLDFGLTPNVADKLIKTASHEPCIMNGYGCGVVIKNYGNDAEVGQVCDKRTPTTVYSSLYVCDASWIPCSVGIYPCPPITTAVEHVSKNGSNTASEFNGFLSEYLKDVDEDLVYGVPGFADGFLPKVENARVRAGLALWDWFGNYLQTYVWEPGQYIIHYILEDKDAFERVGKRILPMGITWVIMKVTKDVQNNCMIIGWCEMAWCERAGYLNSNDGYRPQRKHYGEGLAEYYLGVIAVESLVYDNTRTATKFVGRLLTVDVGTNNEELRWAESSAGHSSLRLYVFEVSPEQDPFYNQINKDYHKHGLKQNKTVRNGNLEGSNGLYSRPTCISDWIIAFAHLFKNIVGLDPDAYLDLHEVGIKLYSEALEDTITSVEAQDLFTMSAEKFQEMAALALFNWGNVHMSRTAYDWAQNGYSEAGKRYEEALIIQPTFYEGILALNQQRFESAKLSWYYAVRTNADPGFLTFNEILQLYNDAEEFMEKGIQMWEEAEKHRLNHHNWATRPEYIEFLHEILSNIKQMYGEKVLIDFEDFGVNNAFKTLAKLIDRMLSSVGSSSEAYKMFEGEKCNQTALAELAFQLQMVPIDVSRDIEEALKFNGAAMDDFVWDSDLVWSFHLDYWTIGKCSMVATNLENFVWDPGHYMLRIFSTILEDKDVLKGWICHNPAYPI